MRAVTLMLLLFASGVAYAQTTAPVATDDTFNTTPGAALTTEAPGVLANDTDAEGDALAATLLTEPSNGILTFNRDGSFVYTPNDGFAGTDTFTYVAEEVSLETFTVDSTQSGVRFEATLNTPAGDDSDSDSSSVTGIIVADVTPHTAPFSEIHLMTMTLALADSLDLSFNLGPFGGRLDAVTEPDSMNLFLTQPGDPTAVIDSAFTQFGNEVGISGTLNLDASGLISLVVSDGPLPIAVTAQGDLMGSVTARDAMLNLALPLAFEGTFEVSGNAVDVAVQGFLAATADISPPSQTSNAATVTIVVGVNTASEAIADVPDQFVLEQNYPNPFNPSTTISYTLPTASAVSLTVYDVLGRQVATLVDTRQAAGRHTVAFEASSLPGGVYLYRLHTGSFTAMKTLVVVK